MPAINTPSREIHSSNTSALAVPPTRGNFAIFRPFNQETDCPTGEALAHASRLGLGALDYDYFQVIGNRVYRHILGSETLRNQREAWVTSSDHALKLCRSASLAKQFTLALTSMTKGMDAQAKREIGSHYAQQIAGCPKEKNYFVHCTAVIGEMTAIAASLAVNDEEATYWASIEERLEAETNLASDQRSRLIVALQTITAHATDLMEKDTLVFRYITEIPHCDVTRLVEYVEEVALLTDLASSQTAEQLDENTHSRYFGSVPSGFKLYDEELLEKQKLLRSSRSQHTKTDDDWHWGHYLQEAVEAAELQFKTEGEVSEDVQTRTDNALSQYVNRNNHEPVSNSHLYEFAGYVNDIGEEALPDALATLPAMLMRLYVYGQPAWEPQNGAQFRTLVCWFIEYRFGDKTEGEKRALRREIYKQKLKGEMPRLESTNSDYLLYAALEAAQQARFYIPYSMQDIASIARQALNALYPEGISSEDAVVQAMANVLDDIQRDRHLHLMRTRPFYRKLINTIKATTDTNKLRDLSAYAYRVSQTTKSEQAVGNYHDNQLSPLECALVVTAKTLRQEKLEANVCKTPSATFWTLKKRVQQANASGLRGIKFAIYANNQPGSHALQALRKQFLSLTGQEQKALWQIVKDQSARLATTTTA